MTALQCIWPPTVKVEDRTQSWLLRGSGWEAGENVGLAVNAMPARSPLVCMPTGTGCVSLTFSLPELLRVPHVVWVELAATSSSSNARSVFQVWDDDFLLSLVLFRSA
jgi:hypothetical protein